MWHDLLSVVSALAIASASVARAGEPPAEELADLSLEQLGNVEIISVSRHSERLSEAPASIYVISHEDIARSGATTLPEALRLAPNLDVARVSASSYAISARGFNNSLGNKLLVLIDGRTVYTPLFSGVFWDAQDLLLEDVERIEVISGPGATLWGANAVNGVINVITRRASASQGLLAGVQVGADGSTSTIRYGGALGPSGAYRVYARHNEIDATRSEAGATQPDGWRSDQVGFRSDWASGAHEFTVQGDAYRGRSQERPFGPIEISGGNLLAAWDWRRAGGGSVRAQAYLDRTDRLDPVLFHDRMDVFDLEFQHAIPFEHHDLLWGGGVRRARDEVEPGLLVRFDPADKDLHWENLFVQDEVRLRDALRLTLGLKLDRNVYTGIELLPSVRLAWKPGDNQLLWAAASRAVRAPSRIDREFFLPANPPFAIAGGPDFESEVSDVFELGYRAQAGRVVSYSLTAFHHDYDRLRSGEPQPDGSFHVENGTAGRVWGVEGWGNAQLTRRWRLSAGFVELRESFRTKAGFHDPDGPVDLGNDPRFQWSLRSSLDLGAVDFDLWARRVGELPEPEIPAYTAVDASLRWRPQEQLELSLFVHDALDDGHVEFAPGPLVAASEFDRSISFRVQWQWQ